MMLSSLMSSSRVKIDSLTNNNEFDVSNTDNCSASVETIRDDGSIREDDVENVGDGVVDDVIVCVIVVDDDDDEEEEEEE